MGAKEAAVSFAGGLVMTLILVTVVPVIVDTVVERYVSELVGDSSFLMLSSDVIVNLIVWIVIIGLMVLLGSGGILKRYGVFGVVGLIAAYWLLGDITDAFIPLATLAIVLVIGKTIQIKKGKKNADKG